jgi:hypothetical protein
VRVESCGATHWSSLRQVVEWVGDRVDHTGHTSIDGSPVATRSPHPFIYQNYVSCCQEEQGWHNLHCARSRWGHSTGMEKLTEHNKQFHNLYSLPNIIKIGKSMRIRWAGNVACTRNTRNSFNVLVWKPAGKRALGRSRHGCKNQPCERTYSEPTEGLIRSNEKWERAGRYGATVATRGPQDYKWVHFIRNANFLLQAGSHITR